MVRSLMIGTCIEIPDQAQPGSKDFSNIFDVRLMDWAKCSFQVSAWSQMGGIGAV